jgi:hypothetical protein
MIKLLIILGVIQLFHIIVKLMQWIIVSLIVIKEIYE